MMGVNESRFECRGVKMWVAGIRNARNTHSKPKRTTCPKSYKSNSMDITGKTRKNTTRYWQDVEITIERGKLWMTPNPYMAKRTCQIQPVKIAVDMAKEQFESQKGRKRFGITPDDRGFVIASD